MKENSQHLSFLLKGSDINAIQQMIDHLGLLTGFHIALLDKHGIPILHSQEEEKPRTPEEDHLCFDPAGEKDGLLKELRRTGGPVIKSCATGNCFAIAPVYIKEDMFGNLIMYHFRLAANAEKVRGKAGVPLIAAKRAKDLIRLMAGILSKGLVEHISQLEDIKTVKGTDVFFDGSQNSWMIDMEPVSEVSAVEALIRLEKSQAALRNSVERYHTLVDNIPAVVYRCEIYPPWYMHYISEDIEQLTGYEAQDFYRGGKVTYADIVHKEDVQLVVDAIQSTLNSGEHYNIEYRIVRKDGTIRWVYERGRFYFDEKRNPLYLDGVIMDITEKKNMLQERQSIEVQFKTIFDHMLEAVILHDLVYDAEGNITDYVIRDVNPAFCKISGLTRDELIGRKAGEIFKNGAKPSLEQHEHAYMTGEPVSYESYYAPLNKYFHVSLTSLSPGQFVTVMLDFTQSHEDREQLKLALQEREVLVREVHHRVKNNLQAIIHLIEDQIENATDEKWISSMATLKNQAYTMALIYDQLNKTHHLSQIEMHSYLEELTSNINSSFQRSDPILITVDCGDLWLEVDQAMPCAMIINELITNAHKYAFPKGSAGDHHLLIRLSLAQDIVKLLVRDNGTGLPEGLNTETLSSQGLRMIRLWAVHQLGGRLNMYNENGLVTEIEFPFRNSEFSKPYSEH